MIRIIPYEKLSFTTSHSPAEIKRRLEQGVSVPRGGGFKALRKAEKPFEGTIENNKFLFWRAIRHTNGFMPLIEGTIEPGKIKVELKWHPFMRIFFPLWMAMLIFLGEIAAAQTPDSTCWWGVKVPFAIVVLVYLLGIYFYNFYAGKAKAFLQDVVK